MDAEVFVYYCFGVSSVMVSLAVLITAIAIYKKMW